MRMKGTGKHTRTFAIPVTTKVKQLCAYDEKRTCVFIYNNGDNTVYILSKQNMKYTDGIPVAASGTYRNNSTYAELWIVAATGTNDVRVQVDGD